MGDITVALSVVYCCLQMKFMKSCTGKARRSSGNHKKTVLEMFVWTPKDLWFSSWLSMWKCYIITLCLNTMRTKASLFILITNLSTLTFVPVRANTDSIISCELGPFGWIRLTTLCIQLEGGVLMVSSREHGEHDPFWRHIIQSMIRSNSTSL